MSDIDERLQRYLEGSMARDERLAFEREVLASPELSDRLYAEVNLRAALEGVTNRRTQTRSWWRRPAVRWGVPAVVAAALAVLLVLPRNPETDRGPRYRGTGAVPVAVAPRGEVAAPPERFVWRDAGAPYYRLELFAADATPVASAVVADTIYTIDPASTPVPDRGYWVLTPLDDLHVSAGKPLVTRYRVSR